MAKVQTTAVSRMPEEAPPPRPLPPDPSTLGIPVQDCNPALAAAFYAELTNKLSWALGSTYGRTYHKKTGPVREFAWQLTKRIAQMQGLPEYHKIK